MSTTTYCGVTFSTVPVTICSSFERSFGLSLFLLKRLKSGCEIFHGWFFFRPGAGTGAVSAERLDSVTGSECCSVA